MLKKILTIILASATVLSLGACTMVAPAVSTPTMDSPAVTAVDATDTSRNLFSQSTEPALNGSMATTLDASYPVAGITKIDIDYNVAMIEVKVSGTDQITVLETTNSTDQSTFGKITQEQDSLKLKQSLKAMMNTPDTNLIIELPSSFTGELEIDANVSDITVASELSLANLEISANVGNILIDGSLSTFSKIDISSNVGAVEVTLPADLAFSYDISVDVGEITSDFFTVVSEDFVGQKAEGSTGNLANLHMEIDVNTGDIVLKKA